MKRNLINILLGLLVFAIALLIHNIRHNYKTQKWPAVEVRVVASFVNEEFGNTTYYYKPFIKYSYVVDNEKYEDVYYDAISNGHLEKESALEVIKLFPEGKTIIIHYNPNNPKDSIIADLQ